MMKQFHRVVNPDVERVFVIQSDGRSCIMDDVKSVTLQKGGVAHFEHNNGGLSLVPPAMYAYIFIGTEGAIREHMVEGMGSKKKEK